MQLISYSTRPKLGTGLSLSFIFPFSSSAILFTNNQQELDRLNEEGKRLHGELNASDYARSSANHAAKSTLQTLERIQDLQYNNLSENLQQMVDSAKESRDRTETRIKEQIRELDTADPRSEPREVELEDTSLENRNNYINQVGEILRISNIPVPEELREHYKDLRNIQGIIMTNYNNATDIHLSNVNEYIDCTQKIESIEEKIAAETQEESGNTAASGTTSGATNPETSNTSNLDVPIISEEVPSNVENKEKNDVSETGSNDSNEAYHSAEEGKQGDKKPGSLIDDYADVSAEHPSHMDPDD